MKLDRPLIVLDMETTGVDPCIDRIIEMGVVVLFPDGTRSNGWRQRFNPGIQIPEAATEVHGIRDEDVAAEPRFADLSKKIHRAMNGRDIAGYNLRRLDLPILDEELRRCDLKLDLESVRIIDAFGIYQNKEPRQLANAVRLFCGRDHDGAHGALADAIATADVLEGQLERYEDLAGMDLDSLAAFSRYGEVDYIDLAGKIYRDKDGFARWNFSKNKDQRVIDDLGFANWVLKKDFPGNTKDAVWAELQAHNQEMLHGHS